MSTGSSPNPFLSNPFPLVAMMLLAAGVLVRNIPLESARPGDADRASPSIADMQDVPARLWQDPFAAVNAAKAQATKEGRKAEEKLLRTPDRLHKQLLRFNERYGAPAQILGVMASTSAFAEDAEQRRRVRYAVVQGLSAAGYTPRDPEGLGYIEIDQAQSDRLPARVPFEWFEWSKAERKPGQSESAQDLKDRPPILLLWLEENVLGRQPAQRIAQLIQLICKEPAKLCDEKLLQERLVFIGPGTSAGLAKLTESVNPDKWNEAKRKDKNGKNSKAWPQLGKYKLDFYSPFATNPGSTLKLPTKSEDKVKGKPNAVVQDTTYEACLFPRRPGYETGAEPAGGCPIRIFRTIGGDDVLAEMMSRELAARGVNGEGWACNDQIVIVGERDTVYGRELSKQFRSALQTAPGCGGETEDHKNKRVWEVSYLRGLDGVVAETGVEKTPSIKRDASGKIDIQSLDAPGALRERAEGRSQFDYVRRLAQKIRDHEQDEIFESQLSDYARLEGAPKIKAIGVLGNDVYDKLLILQALQSAFPYAIFFTTDLDARLLHADQGDWTRNLVVASNYGFSLRPKLHGSASPFRNGYQTATYLATLLAAQNMEPGLDTLQAGQAAGEKLGRWSRPEMYEIGRTRAISLQPLKTSASDVSPPQPLSAEALKARKLAEDEDKLYCDEKQPLKCQYVQAVEIIPVSSTPLALAALISGTFLLLLSSRKLRDRVRAHFWQTLLIFGLAAVLVVLVVSRVLRDVTSQLIEPFAWFEGVSLWPSVLILLVAAAVALMSILYICAAFARAKSAIIDPENGFFPEEEGGATLGTRRWALFDEQTSVRTGCRRVVLHTVVCFVFFLTLILLGKHYMPFRGEVVWVCAVAGFTVAGLLLLYLIFQVVDIVKHTTDIVGWLAKCDTEYPDKVRQRYAAQLGLEDCCNASSSRERTQVLESWIDFRLVVQLTTDVERFIYFPFFVLLIFALAQIRIFDDWQISPAILTVVAIFVAYVMYCSFSLRRAAEAARGRALKHYSDCLLYGAGSRTTPCGPTRLIKELMTRISETRAGAFRPFFQQPALRSLLIPFGGMGGYSVIEYLFARV